MRESRWRFSTIRTATLCLVLLVSLSFTAWAGKVAIVKDGKPLAVIVIAKDASAQVATAAKTLASYIKQSSGADMKVVTDDRLAEEHAGLTIQVGRTAIADPVELPSGLDGDGFIIRVKPNTIVICGPTDWGTQFGVYEFLERYVGVRWLMPGVDGDDVPKMAGLEIPEGILRDQPVFISRQLSGLAGDCQVEWANFSRMHGRVKFHHNLVHLFPPSKYAKTHLEIYPMLDGKVRFVPPDDNDDVDWQPCFSAPGIVNEAVKSIVQYFKEHPEETSYSLGTNDTLEYCHCPLCKARISGAKNFLGFVDYSDVYYEWCNQVIEGVLKVYPDKWFGCLAYHNVGAPPTNVKLHPRLIPYMTYDRMRWVDAKTRSIGHINTESWAKASSSLGWYDYIYGTPYCLPRVYFHQTAEYLRYGEQHGVNSLYAELYPNFGEGPKPYIFFRLWWNPNQDVDVLLKEWYERCVGPDAAPYLAKYYKIWERFWTKDILDSDWFANQQYEFLSFGSPSYLAHVKREDILKSRVLLDTVIAKCRTEKQRARAELLEKAFQYYEASALAYLGDVPTPTVIKTEAEALQVLNDSDIGMRMDQKRRHLALDVYPSDPVLRHPIGIDILNSKNWGSSGMLRIVDWIRNGNEAVRRRVENMADDSQPENVREQARLVLAIADGKTISVSHNPSFEGGQGDTATDWEYWVAETGSGSKPQGRMLRAEGIAHTGKTSLLCDSIGRGGPTQSLAGIAPGKYCIIAWVYVTPGQKSTRTVQAVLNAHNGANVTCLLSTQEVLPTTGVWTPLVGVGMLPSGAASARLTAIVNGFQPSSSKVYLDDLELHRIP